MRGLRSQGEWEMIFVRVRLSFLICFRCGVQLFIGRVFLLFGRCLLHRNHPFGCFPSFDQILCIECFSSFLCFGVFFRAVVVHNRSDNRDVNMCWLPARDNLTVEGLETHTFESPFSLVGPLIHTTRTLQTIPRTVAPAGARCQPGFALLRSLELLRLPVPAAPRHCHGQHHGRRLGDVVLFPIGFFSLPWEFC